MRILSYALVATALVALSAAAAGPIPEVSSPRQEQHIGDADDNLCPKTERFCSYITAKGSVSPDRVPFLAVQPVKDGRIWIQRPIGSTRSDGSFHGSVNLGRGKIGAEEWFKIFVFACQSKDTFTEGQRLDDLNDVPADCEISEPVSVYRVR